MKIMMLAWRDLKHSKMGGAEVVTDIYLKGLAGKGHEVVLVCPSYDGARSEEDFEKYSVKRIGRGLGAHFKILKYAKKHQGEYDFIIDQINTVPFFTPFGIDKKKRIAFFHQLCRNIWFYEKSFPISLVGYILESLYLKFYWNTRAFVVSDSTREDLVKHAWMKKENILVLDNQIDFEPVKRISKKENYFVFVGRLTKSKRVQDCIKALSEVKTAKLYVIGNGEYRKNLEELAEKLKLEKRVIFTGKVSRAKRNSLMTRAKAILVTSVKEGWGLIVTEANANGTAAITYDIDGVRDANKTGFITKRNTPKELAKLMNLVLNNSDLIEDKSKTSLYFARKHADWDKNVRKLESWLLAGRMGG